MPVVNSPARDQSSITTHTADSRGTSQQPGEMDPVGTSLRTQPDVQHAAVDAAQLVKILPFWKENPSLWFAQIEAAFGISRISSDETKFRYVVVNLEPTILPVVADIVARPPDENKYLALKNRIVTSLEETSLENYYADTKSVMKNHLFFFNIYVFLRGINVRTQYYAHCF